MTARRKEPATTREFAKNPSQERFLEHLNEVLAEHETALYRPAESSPPICFITGVPRSGTTLAHQILCASLDIGYVNNLIAAFWRAPVHGIRLAKMLLADRRSSSFDSRFGRTEELTGPHEFGYFWSEMLGYDQPIVGLRAVHEIDWDKLVGALVAMACEFDRPLVLKSFHLGWYGPAALRLIPRSGFIWVRRDLSEIAASLLEMRRKFLGSESEWASFRPRGAEELEGASPVEQVAAQAVSIEREIERSLGTASDDRVMIVEYADICDTPRAFVEDACDFLERLATRPVTLADPPPRFQSSSYRARDPELFERIEEAIARVRDRAV